jgi:hypothetical protein
LRRSSPPSTRISKAQRWTSSLCLPECNASKSEMPARGQPSRSRRSR